jgi:hypothetical protein
VRRAARFNLSTFFPSPAYQGVTSAAPPQPDNHRGTTSPMTIRRLLPAATCLAWLAATTFAGHTFAQGTAEGGGSAADGTAAEASAATTEASAVDRPRSADSAADAYEVRQDFMTVLQRHPYEVGRLLALDPTLLGNDTFLAGYPELQRFVAAHPEMRRSPRFFLSQLPREDGSVDVLEPFLVFAAFAGFLLAMAWLVRTSIDQLRWSRVSRTQSDVHNKILERFGTSEALLEYMRSPAGSRFLESAPIRLHGDPPPAAATPASRALTSIQVGLVLAAGAVGALVVAGRFEHETAQGFFALGVIGLSVGIGFVLSAVASIVLSRRLGIWQPGGSGEAPSASRLVE